MEGEKEKHERKMNENTQILHVNMPVIQQQNTKKTVVKYSSTPHYKSKFCNQNLHTENLTNRDLFSQVKAEIVMKRRV